MTVAGTVVLYHTHRFAAGLGMGVEKDSESGSICSGLSGFHGTAGLDI